MFGFSMAENGEECKFIDVDSNFDKYCYKSTITLSVMLKPDTPPPTPNKHFHQYYIDYEEESLIINSIRAYSGLGDIKTKKECINIRDVTYKKLKEKYFSNFYEEKYKIYPSKNGDDFDDKKLITIYDKEKFGTDDMYSIQFELHCYFSDIKNENIILKASLSRDYPRSVIEFEELEIKDIDTSGF